MYSVHLAADADELAFREAARRAISHNVAPSELTFVRSNEPGLFHPLPEGVPDFRMSVLRAYAELLRDVICHRAPDRFSLLYQVLWRLKHGEPELLSRASDAAVAKLMLYAKAVHRDIHKMHAFLRFRAKPEDGEDVFFAWFEPEHFILRRAAPFFVDRFANMRWIIATPIGTALWDKADLRLAPAGPKPDDVEDDVLSGAWRTYYKAVFNPARVNVGMMTKEMPKKYWRNMPEAALIPDLIAAANQRVSKMNRQPDLEPRYARKIADRRAKPTVALPDAWAALKEEVAGCAACPLHRFATQAVFGEGPRDGRLVFIGEQPGDSEDIAARPFVGPAGQVFDRALRDAGIERAKVYVTNAVKHFKFEPRGKRRLHKRPSSGEVQVCRQWLSRELDFLDADIVVALGATAAQALSGKPTPISKHRGRRVSWPDGRRGLITVHPSYLLRLPDKAAQAAEYESFVADLKLAASLVRSAGEGVAPAQRNAP